MVPAGTSTSATATVMVIVAALIVLDVAAIRGSSPTADVIALQFPLRDGTFLVLQGGRSAITNPFHYASPAGRLSLDVVRLGVLGTRSRSPLSYQLSDYFTYGVPVSSPCAGDVVTVVDGLADNPPGKSDVDHPAGNHVLLRCDSDPHVVVLLAHLRSASVLIHAGDRVSADQVLGAVGNSGTTSEPHLHIQATRGDLDSGSAVSMVFDGRFLMANSLIFDDD